MSEAPNIPAGATLSDAYCESILRIAGESRYVESAGGRVHYLAWGTVDCSLPVLLFVHGMLGHAHWWDIIAPFFAEKYKVLAIDLSGMGDSAHRDIYDNQVFTRDIAAVVEWEGGAPAIIVGHSFGGSRTVMACIDRPELFRGAIVIDSPIWLIGEKLPDRKPRGGHVYPDKVSALARFRLAPEQPVCSPALRSHVAERSLVAVPGGWTWKFDPRLGIGQSLMDPALFDSLQTPMDFIRGEYSSVLSKERMEQIAGTVKTLRRVVTIPAGYHHLMLDQPLTLVSVLSALLTDG